jgi:hypothetical protein
MHTCPVNFPLPAFADILMASRLVAAQARTTYQQQAVPCCRNGRGPRKETEIPQTLSPHRRCHPTEAATHTVYGRCNTPLLGKHQEDGALQYLERKDVPQLRNGSCQLRNHTDEHAQAQCSCGVTEPVDFPPVQELAQEQGDSEPSHLVEEEPIS